MNTQNIIKALTLSFCFMFLACSIKPTEPPDGTYIQPANHLDSILTPISEIEATFANQDMGIWVDSVIYAHGDYIWKSQGGLVHWTHHDPAEVHEDGWIVFQDVKYE